ncbi:unnamed protein product, partial [Closterium sp. NIES-53]
GYSLPLLLTSSLLVPGPSPHISNYHALSDCPPTQRPHPPIPPPLTPPRDPLPCELQVATRFLSSPPPLYWFLAHLLTSGHSKQSQSKPPSPSPRKYLPFELQVATRFLSSSPPLYWLLAHLLTSGYAKQSQPGPPTSLPPFPSPLPPLWVSGGNSLPLLLTSSLLVPGPSPHIGKYQAL